MTTYKLFAKELFALENEKGNICVSIIVPVLSKSPDRRIETLNIKHAFEKAALLLKAKYQTGEALPLIEAMDEFYKTIDFTGHPYGRGYYISSNVNATVTFPFPIQEIITVGSSFELRYPLYKLLYAKTYFLLLLTETENRLYKGNWEQLSEITDNEFPVAYTEEYIYASPSPGSSYAGYAHVKMFEKDKSELELIRIRDFFKKTDKSLDNYLLSDTPLIIMGVERNLSLYDEVTNHRNNIIAKLPGNHKHDNINELQHIAWLAMSSYLDNKGKKIVSDFTDHINTNRAVSGIRDVWTATQHRKALTLLVEKDYRTQGFLTDDGSRLYLKAPGKPHRNLADAVNDVIETVIKKKGEVYFLENGALSQYGHIGLITRH